MSTSKLAATLKTHPPLHTEIPINIYEFYDCNHNNISFIKYTSQGKRPYRNSLKAHMNIYPFSTYSYPVYNEGMDHVGNLYHQRNEFYLEKREGQLPLSGQVHLPNAKS